MKGWLFGGVLLLALLVVAAKVGILQRVRAGWRAGPAGTPALPVTDPRQSLLLVFNSRGSAVPGATVTFRRDGQEEPVAVATLDAGGSLKFRLPDEERDWGGLRVRAHMGPLAQEIVLRGAPGDHLEFRLPESLVLRGTVVRKGTGTPMAGVPVRTGKGTVRTGDDGRFQVAFAPSPNSLDGSLRMEVLEGGEAAWPFAFPWTAAGEDLFLEVGN